MEVLTSRTIIHPSDLEETLAFYQVGLGLAVAREFGAGDRRGVVFFAGGGLIEVVGGGPPPPAPGGAPAGAGGGPPPPAPGGAPAGGPVVLWLQVRALDEALAELSNRGVRVVRPAQLEPWGLLEAWVDDPDGLRIHLVEVPADHPLRRDLRPAEPSGERS